MHSLPTVIVTQIYITYLDLHPYIRRHSVHTQRCLTACVLALCPTYAHAHTHTHTHRHVHAHTQTIYACSKNIFIREAFRLFPHFGNNAIGSPQVENEGYSAHRQKTPLLCSLRLANHHQGCYSFPPSDTPSHRPLLCLTHPWQPAHLHSQPSHVLF